MNWIETYTCCLVVDKRVVFFPGHYPNPNPIIIETEWTIDVYGTNTYTHGLD